MDEIKYKELFIKKFKVNEDQLQNDYDRIMGMLGHNEESKLKFFSGLFDKIIEDYKTKLPKDEHYEYIITKLYDYYIDSLKQDNIDTNHLQKKLVLFKTLEIPKLTPTITENENAPVYKNYNRHTKYGRRKAREQAISNYENGTPEYRREIDNIRAIFWLSIIVITILIYVFKSLLFNSN